MIAGQRTGLLLLLILSVGAGCRLEGPPARMAIEVFNPHSEQWLDAPVTLRLENYALALEPYGRVYRDHGGTLTEIPSQLDDVDLDGTPDQLFFLVNLDAHETARYVVVPDSVEPVYPARVFASIVRRGGGGGAGFGVAASDSLPHVWHAEWSAAVNDGNAPFETVTWGTERVVYAAALDGRGLTDVFAPASPDSSPVDVLAEGAALGLGTTALATRDGFAYLGSAGRTVVDVVADGPLRAIVRTTYTDAAADSATYDVVTEREIHAGSRWVEQRILVLDSLRQRPLVTGIPRSDPAIRLQSGSVHGAFYLYTLGPVTTALLIPDRLHPRLQPDALHDHRVHFAAENEAASYRYMAAWDENPEARLSEAGFREMISRAAVRWMNPIQVSVEE